MPSMDPAAPTLVVEGGDVEVLVGEHRGGGGAAGGVQNLRRWPGAHAAAHVEELTQRDAEGGASYWPGARDVPAERVEREARGDFSLPMDLNQSLPLFRIAGTEAMDSTLFTTVGAGVQTGDRGGKGGPQRGGWPRRPSSESSSAVSSPQMYAPAPACTVSSRSSPEPMMSVPR